MAKAEPIGHPIPVSRWDSAIPFGLRFQTNCMPSVGVERCGANNENTYWQSTGRPWQN